MPTSFRYLLPAGLALACLVAVAMKVSDPPAVQMQTFAENFLASLDETQSAKATMPYDSPKRVGWHFIPMKDRKGLTLGEMDDAQRTAALRLVRAALSEAGYDKTNKIMTLERTLRILEGEGRTWPRDHNLYYVTVFGTPSNQGVWGLSFEGHHLSLNFVCRDGNIVDSTPQFFATNPAIIMNDVVAPEGETVLGKGTRVLRDEEEYAFKIVQSLTESQLATAVIDETAPQEIRFAGEAQPSVGDPEGIPFDQLDKDQQKTLKDLIEVYVGAVADSAADDRRKIIESDGWNNVHFAWAGAKKPGIGHYYRVRGKSFLIEFINTQPDAMGNPANHIHCVYRDLTGDFDLAL
ncbi:hypothetical protein Pla22_01340 [Rubripirellula amarantea]|uniref:DUF3500 domain-containing protein n=1 Tax=Rubripirellula amarantea TaxID=2527999 RepID=A0A5C5WQ01_9BACT|nr:DUF3500 domain-containing protein [Rubripirellula amarantea]TWT52510.1 hypothetical protein Pla22_01340 [Rubripirellula amarantea]